MLSTHRRRRQDWVWTVVASAPRHLLHSKYVDIGVDLNGCVIVYVGDGVKALDQFGCQRYFLFWSSRLLLFVCYVLVLCLFWTTPSGALPHDSNYSQDSDGRQQGNCVRCISCKGPSIYYVIQIWGAGRPPSPYCNIVINWEALPPQVIL